MMLYLSHIYSIVTLESYNDYMCHVCDIPPQQAQVASLQSNLRRKESELADRDAELARSANAVKTQTKKNFEIAN